MHLSLGMLEEAEEDFKAALQSNPSHAHFPHYRAVVHARKGELGMAVGPRREGGGWVLAWTGRVAHVHA